MCMAQAPSAATPKPETLPNFQKDTVLREMPSVPIIMYGWYAMPNNIMRHNQIKNREIMTRKIKNLRNIIAAALVITS